MALIGVFVDEMTPEPWATTTVIVVCFCGRSDYLGIAAVVGFLRRDCLKCGEPHVPRELDLPTDFADAFVAAAMISDRMTNLLSLVL